MTPDTKADIFQLLGCKCSQCGYDAYYEALHICFTDGETRGKTPYGDFLLAAFRSASEGDGGFLLWCANCRAHLIASNRNAPDVVKSVAVWRSPRPTLEFLVNKSPWLEHRMIAGLEAFLLPDDGKVYAYQPKVPAVAQEAVAYGWEEFAKARGLPTKLPAYGTQVVRPEEKESK